MSKAHLSFNLPEDSVDFDLAVKGPKLRLAVDEFYNELRNVIKYDNVSIVEQEFDSEDDKVSAEHIIQVAIAMRKILIKLEDTYNSRAEE